MLNKGCTRFSHSVCNSYKRSIFSNFREIFVKSKTLDPKEDIEAEKEGNKSVENNESKELKDQNAPNFELKSDSDNNNKIEEFKFLNYQNKRELYKDPFFPPFSKLDQGHIEAHTNYSIPHQLFSPYRWTPLIQKVKPSIQFHERMYQFRKVRGWEDHHTKELVDAFLFEALKGTDYDYYYDYKCEPSKGCKFHGTVDFLIYKKTGDHLPFVPVFITKKEMNPVLNQKLDQYNVFEAVGAAAWTLTNMSARNKAIDKTRILQTNGHTWRMYQFNKEGEFKKTGIYKPNTPGVYKKIYDDPEMQEVALGMIRFAACMHTENEIGLQKAYDFIDEAKYLEELDENTKSKFEKRQRFWRFLPKGIRDLFFNYK